MKEKTIKIYRFDELSREAQEKVVENHWQDFVQYDWWQDIFEDFTIKLRKEYGFKVGNIRFSGFGSQGDGASFTGEFDDPIEASEKFLAKYTIKAERNMLSDLINYLGIVRDTGRYVHKNTVSCVFDIKEIWGDYHEQREDAFLERRGTYGKLVKKVEAWKDNMCDELYKELEEMYDFLTGYEHISDYYTNCDDEEQFLEDGSDA